jgi:bifunctional DNA-binding transcriptional regulator/antitoxin component of YhaV-PrlF toxin-antitoxin module
MVRVQRLPNGQLVITIPKKIAEYEGIKKGTDIKFKKNKGGILLKCD